MSSFYSTNNSKFKAYKAGRRKEEKYYDDQQDQIDEMLAEARGEVSMISRYSQLAKNVINQFGQDIQVDKPAGSKPVATDFLSELIKTGRLSEVFDKIKKMNLESLSPEAQNIVKDIKNPAIRASIVSDFNSQLSNLMAKRATPDETINRAETTLAENQALRKAGMNPGIAEMVAERARQMAEKRDITAFENIRSVAQKKKGSALHAELTQTLARREREQREREGMQGEDIDAIERIKKLVIDTTAKGNEPALKEVFKTLEEEEKSSSPKPPSPKPPASPTGSIFSDALTVLSEDDINSIIESGNIETNNAIINDIKSLNNKLGQNNKYKFTMSDLNMLQKIAPKLANDTGKKKADAVLRLISTQVSTSYGKTKLSDEQLLEKLNAKQDKSFYDALDKNLRLEATNTKPKLNPRVAAFTPSN